MEPTVGFISLGCAKNQVDTEGIAGMLRDEGFVPVGDMARADIIVINTCCFIAPAKEESIDAILDAARHKKRRCKVLAVVGCLVQRYGEELQRLIPEVDLWVGTGEYDRLPRLLKEASDLKTRLFLGKPGWLLPEGRQRLLSTPAGWAYLKLADGCDNRCTYCVIPSVRGPLRSRTIASVLEEAAGLIARGVKEINLIAQDITAFGRDRNPPETLTDLLAEMDALPGDFWIRLLYAYPTGISPELLRLMAEGKHILHYLDLPIQHCSPVILARMGRSRTIPVLPGLIQEIRRAVPDAAIRSTFIVGFPGETEAEFQELLSFVRRSRLDWAGVFPYSREEGTPAADLRPGVHPATRARRARQLMEVQAAITAERLASLAGGRLRILVEEADAGGGWGRSYREAPEIDGKIYFTGSARPGEFREVRITGRKPPYDLLGELDNS